MEMTGDGAGCSRLIWLERGVCDSQCGGFVESSRCRHGKGVGRPELVGDCSFGLTVLDERRQQLSLDETDIAFETRHGSARSRGGSAATWSGRRWSRPPCNRVWVVWVVSLCNLMGEWRNPWQVRAGGVVELFRFPADAGLPPGMRNGRLWSQLRARSSARAPASDSRPMMRGSCIC